MNSQTFAVIETAWDDRVVEAAVDEAIALRKTSVRRSSMKLGPYNGFDGQIRVLADFRIKVALELGLIPKPCECSVCGATAGRIDYHAEDYSRPLLVATICMKCHMSLHNRLRGAGHAKGWANRVAAHGNGTKWFEFLDRFPAEASGQEGPTP